MPRLRQARALVACVALKFILNQGVARWQLATGSTNHRSLSATALDLLFPG
jgi:hypothetical protein